MKLILKTICLVCLAIQLPALAKAPSEKAIQLTKQAVLIDGHNDLPWKFRKNDDLELNKFDLRKSLKDWHTDIPRLRRGGVGAQFWSAYVPAATMFDGTAVRKTLEQIDVIHRIVKKYPDTFAMASTADDIKQIHKRGKIASLIGVEGGHSIDNSLSVLRLYYKLGVRYMTLTHSLSLEWADAATGEKKNEGRGINAFGKKIVREMNQLGMFVDLSHVSAEVMRAAIKVSRAPVIFSHSSAYAKAKHNRNVPDDVLRLLKNNGGVVMVNFYSGFVDPKAADITKDMFEVYAKLRKQFPDEKEYEKQRALYWKKNPLPKGTVATVADHIDHIVKIAGIDHVGLGADYDGVSTLPEGLEDVSTYPNLTQELLDRGYKEQDIKKVLGDNVLRAMASMERIAKKLSHVSLQGAEKVKKL